MAGAQVKRDFENDDVTDYSVADVIHICDDEEVFNEQTLAAIDEARQLSHSPCAKRYDSPQEAFDDVLGANWR